MHKEILSDHDRAILKKFIESSEKAQGFRRVKFNVLKYHKKLNQDFNLIEQAFKKFHS